MFNIGRRFFSLLEGYGVPKRELATFLPDEIKNELISAHAALEGVGSENPLRNTPRDTLLVRPDLELGAVLRENASVCGYILRPLQAFNFVPPALYLPHDFRPSSRLSEYLERQSLLKFTYNIDAEGYRQTIPTIIGEERLLVVGDSVGFGTYVEDSQSIPSHLQRLLCDKLQVCNACVGDFDGPRAAAMAARRSQQKKFKRLVYVACQNDFMQHLQPEVVPLEKATRTLQSLKELTKDFEEGITIYFHTYLEYCMRHFFLDEGWGEWSLAQTEILRSELPGLCSELGFAYGDWTDVVTNYAKEQRSLYSEFALYIDHCHLSPLGNSLAAKHIFSILTKVQTKGGDD